MSGSKPRVSHLLLPSEQFTTYVIVEVTPGEVMVVVEVGVEVCEAPLPPVPVPDPVPDTPGTLIPVPVGFGSVGNALLVEAPVGREPPLPPVPAPVPVPVPVAPRA